MGCGKKEEAVPPAAPPVVLVAEATQAEAPVFGEAIATLEGSTETPIHAQVSGYLIRQAYQEGAAVKAGDLLFQLDPRPFHAALDKAQGSGAAASVAAAKKISIQPGSRRRWRASRAEPFQAWEIGSFRP